MDVDSEIKMREKMAKDDENTTKDRDLVLAKGSGTGTEMVVTEDADGAGVPVANRPGAVAVRGPEYQGSGFGDASLTTEGPGTGGGGEGGGDDEAPPLQVDSYVVQERLTDEEIRQRILANTEHAQVVDKVEPRDAPPQGLSRNATVWILAVVVVVAAAMAVGIAVPLSNQTTSGSSTQQRDPDVVASLKYVEWQGSGGFAGAITAETRISAGSFVTSGAVEGIQCRPKVCSENGTNCLAGDFVYEPGCCAGADCPNETKCGQRCPPPPTSCRLTDPGSRDTCHRSECYTCEDDYVLRDLVIKIDCLEVGTAIRPDNGLEYKWAIFCGPLVSGPTVEDNRDYGEYQCEAARLGANFSDEIGGSGLLGFITPCQYIALAECGCGPSDIYTFGLPAPNGTCQPDSGCPILCEGVGGGNDYARNLCRSFPGNISWWEGNNVFNSTQFTEDTMAPEYEFEIYIKGVDP